MRPLIETVQNFDELRRYFSGGPYQKFFSIERYTLTLKSCFYPRLSFLVGLRMWCELRLTRDPFGEPRLVGVSIVEAGNDNAYAMFI